MDNTNNNFSCFSHWETKIINNGSYSKISLCNNLNTSEKIVVKQCKANIKRFNKNSEHIAYIRWKNEIETLKRLNHSNIVKAVKIPASLRELFDSNFPLLGMEYCSGGNLRSVLNKPHNCCGLTEFTIRSILKDISSAIIFLHSEKIVHKDIKPENIVMQPTTNGHNIYKLIDLGLYKSWNHETILRSFANMFKYLAPEVLTSGKCTYSVDYWSFGILVHELITGIRPFFHNSSPFKYLDILKNKSSDIICAYKCHESKEIILANEIVFNNHLSSLFKKQIEEWLSLVLECDEHKRSLKSPIEKLNNEILNKFILKILVLNTFEVHFYDIKNDMNLNDLKVLIYSNTDILPENQMLFVCSKGTINTQESIEANRNLLEVFLSLQVIQILILDKSQPVNNVEYKIKSIIPQKMQDILFQSNLKNIVTYKKKYNILKDYVWISMKVIEHYSVLLQASNLFFNYNQELHWSANSQLIKLMTKNSKLDGNLEATKITLVHNLNNFLMMQTINENVGFDLVFYCHDYMKLCKNRRYIEKKINDIVEEFEKTSKFVEFKPDIFDYNFSEPNNLSKETFFTSLDIVEIYNDIMEKFTLFKTKSKTSMDNDTYNSNMAFKVHVLLNCLEKKTEVLIESIKNIINLFLIRLNIISKIKKLHCEIVEQSKNIKKYCGTINSVLWDIVKSEDRSSVNEELEEEIKEKIVECLSTLSINEEF